MSGLWNQHTHPSLLQFMSKYLYSVPRATTETLSSCLELSRISDIPMHYGANHGNMMTMMFIRYALSQKSSPTVLVSLVCLSFFASKRPILVSLA